LANIFPRGLAVAAIVWVGICAGVVMPAPLARAEPGFDNLSHELPEFRSVDGVLRATLEARARDMHVGKADFPGMAFNGVYGGPVLRVHPGEVMRIKLRNRLGEPTNLHFHGLHTSPRGNSDNMHVVVQSGHDFDYEVKIPATQPPGLYWYHTHIHGSAETQVMAGLSGALVVEGFARQFPELSGVRERLFVLKDYSVEESADPEIEENLHDLVQSVNGQGSVKLAIRPGETQLWRFTNQSANRYFHIAVPNHKFRIIGEDGIAAAKETVADTLDIKPAARVEALIDGGEPGSYDFVSQRVLTGTGETRSQNRILGQVVVEGEAAKPVAALTFPKGQDLSGREMDAKRTVVFSQTLNDDRNFFVDGRKFDPKRIDLRVPLGNVEEWTIKNISDDMHVFHIHQVSFQVTEIDGVAQPFNGYVDVARVPEKGEIKIRMAFTDPEIVGYFMYHCHVLKHEDNGMMANIEIFDPKAAHEPAHPHSP